ncbi:MAG: hypothetical protein V1681_05295 [Candidatus Neomarinimicrobiota bacterium]
MYDIRPSDYYLRGKKLNDFYVETKNKAFLVYAALEYRICIERYLFEVLVLLKIDDVPRKYEKLYRVGELSKTIYEIEPDFINKIKFTNIILSALRIDSHIFIPNMDYLNEIYGKLGAYLHTIKDPEKTVKKEDWWKNLSSLILRTQSYIEKMIKNDLGTFELNEYGLEIYNKWLNGKLSVSQLTLIVRSKMIQNNHGR